MTPKRAQEILSSEKWDGTFPKNFRESFDYSDFRPSPSGYTREEDRFIRKVWETMPGNTCWKEALIRIAFDNYGERVAK